MKKSFALVAFGLFTFVGGVSARTILFVGNSFTFGQSSQVKRYKTASVTDLNRTDFGGVPALFKAFTVQAGLDYDVSLETVGGKGLDYHYTEKLSLLDRAWDDVVLQSYSTLDAKHPGDAGILVKFAGLFADTFLQRNGGAKIYLSATWSRADQTYPVGKPWSGKPIQQMGKDIQVAYELAAQKSNQIAGVIPVGLAWNRAIDSGLADPNPYDGIAANQINLWTFDHYHASAYGYYLEALMVFGKVTGLDPLSVGDKERSIDDLGLDPRVIRVLQQIAHDQLAAQH